MLSKVGFSPSFNASDLVTFVRGFPYSNVAVFFFLGSLDLRAIGTLSSCFLEIFSLLIHLVDFLNVLCELFSSSGGVNLVASQLRGVYSYLRECVTVLPLPMPSSIFTFFR